MFELQTFTVFLVAALLVAVTPGPGIFYVAARTLAGGRAEGVASSFCTGIGGLAHVAAGALGVSALIWQALRRSPRSSSRGRSI
jgi:threonine/homoserine/homoserine lactone efflux protein